MARTTSKVLLISANVGSIFEDPEKMLHIWLKEFLATVTRFTPDFLAVHCQEVGGKNYEESMQHVNHFIKTLLGSPEMQQYDKARVFLDEDFTAVDKFTALGCLYFIHQNVQNVQIWDFQDSHFTQVVGREVPCRHSSPGHQQVLSGNIESVSIKEKAKFPQEFFPDFKWSRKGFLRTRWNLCNSIFDLVNIHLFHDASNIVAMETSPSQYTSHRRKALRHTIERFENDKYASVPLFMFGDFNFRLDTHLLVQKLTDKAQGSAVKGKKNEIAKIVFKSHTSGEPILTVEKKAFDHQHFHNEVFSNNNNTWLHEYDQEPWCFWDKMFEYNVTFPPSYPFSEDVNDGTSYMKTRCPAWCDRILVDLSAKSLIEESSNQTPEYNMIGPNICMGDHKPIYLSFQLRHNAGNTNQPLTPPAKEPVRKVISINGEEFEASDMEQINIHDFATFEQEEHITPKFFSTIRRHRDGQGDPSSKKKLFQSMAREVIRAENVLLAFKHYGHRSDSETENESDEESSIKGNTADLETELNENNNLTASHITVVNVGHKNELITGPQVTSYPVAVTPTSCDPSVTSGGTSMPNGPTHTKTPSSSVADVPRCDTPSKSEPRSDRCCAVQ